MSAEVVEQPERLRVSFARELSGFGRSDGLAELVSGGAFLVGAVALALAAPAQPPFSAAVAALYVVALAAAGRVRFHIGAGFTVPTQIVFVPMLCAVPASFVPLLVPLALAIGMSPDVVRGQTRPLRLLVSFGNSWFALGPALILAAAGVDGATAPIALLLAALAAQLLCDFFGNAVRERLRAGISLRELGQEMVSVYLVDAALAPVGLALAFAAQDRPWSIVLVLPLLAVLGIFGRERRARLEQLVELNDAYRGTALVLGDVVESDDAYTGEHCKGVVRLALEVAAEMGLDAAGRRRTEFGALLHDVGKLAVPNEIINKPGSLDEREWQVIKMHTIEGQRMLDRVGGTMREVGAVVRSSHERWDGTGYPDGLSGEAIPLEARIVSACDAFNAMTTTRPYRAAMPAEDARAELERNAGSQFDPAVVSALLRVTAA